jgi:hypothetical protein
MFRFRARMRVRLTDGHRPGREETKERERENLEANRQIKDETQTNKEDRQD